jgi:selT/selW/selH-like putative selenoprotein
LAAEIKKAKGVEATLVKGSNGIFDVYSGDKLVFSKYEEHRFPDASEVIGELE